MNTFPLLNTKFIKILNFVQFILWQLYHSFKLRWDGWIWCTRVFFHLLEDWLGEHLPRGTGHTGTHNFFLYIFKVIITPSITFCLLNFLLLAPGPRYFSCVLLCSVLFKWIIFGSFWPEYSFWELNGLSIFHVTLLAGCSVPWRLFLVVQHFQLFVRFRGKCPKLKNNIN